MPQRSVVMIGSTLVVASLALAGCGSRDAGSSDSGSGSSSDKVAKIGVIAPLSGDLSALGLGIQHSVELAVKEANEKKAIPGWTLEVEAVDDEAKPDVGKNAATKLAGDDAVVGVVDNLNSSVAPDPARLRDREIRDLRQHQPGPDQGVPMAESGWTVFHRICPADAVQGPSIAKFVTEDLGVKKAFLIDDKSTYSVGITDSVEASLAERGVEMQRQQIAATDKDFASVLTKVKEFGPDILFTTIPSPAQAAAIAKQAKSMGIDVTIMGSDGCNDPVDFIENAGGATEGAYATSLGPLVTDLPTAKDFLDRYIAKYGVTSAFTAQSYEATMLVLDAIKSVGVKDGKVDRAAVNDAISKIHYKGILDFPISFLPNGNLATGGIFIIQAKGNKFVQVKGVTL